MNTLYLDACIPPNIENFDLFNIKFDVNSMNDFVEIILNCYSNIINDDNEFHKILCKYQNSKKKRKNRINKMNNIYIHITLPYKFDNLKYKLKSNNIKFSYKYTFNDSTTYFIHPSSTNIKKLLSTDITDLNFTKFKYAIEILYDNVYYISSSFDLFKLSLNKKILATKNKLQNVIAMKKYFIKDGILHPFIVLLILYLIKQKNSVVLYKNKIRFTKCQIELVVS